MNSIIFFDGDCALCNKSVMLVLKMDKKRMFSFSHIESEYAKIIQLQFGIDFKLFNSIILYQNNKLYFKSNAVLRIIRYLNFPINILYVLKIIPRFLRDLFYDFVADSRYRIFGKAKTCEILSAEEKNRFL